MLLAAFALAGVEAAPVLAQDGPAAAPKAEANPLCTFHGEGCEAPPAAWTWQRLEAKIGVFSVELPCDERQANAFGQVLAISKAGFPPASTRACMKASSGFTAALIGLTALPDDTKTPETEALLKGAPDMFTGFAQNTMKGSVPETTFKGRRAAFRSIEKDGALTRVAVIEAGKFALIMLVADIRSDFPGTPEETDAAVNRFFASLEIAE
jgi:hypothetical protein